MSGSIVSAVITARAQHCASAAPLRSALLSGRSEPGPSLSKHCLDATSCSIHALAPHRWPLILINEGEEGADMRGEAVKAEEAQLWEAGACVQLSEADSPVRGASETHGLVGMLMRQRFACARTRGCDNSTLFYDNAGAPAS